MGKKGLVIKTTGFAPLIKENLASIACSIVKPIQGHSNDLLDGAVSTGPYILVRKSDRQIELKKRSGTGPEKVIFEATNHFGDFQKLKDKMSLILVDFDPGKTPGFTKHVNSMLGNWQLSFNNEKGKFSNLELRKAITYGINFKHLKEKLDWSEDRLQGGLFPFGMRGFMRRTFDDKNKSKASKILASLGYSQKNPLKFTILMAKGHGSEKAKPIWGEVFGDLPIVSRIELVDQTELVRRRDAGDFEALYHGKAAGSHDPHIILASYLSSSRFNTPRIKNKSCDSKIRHALSEHDHDLRWAHYKDAEKCLLGTYFIVPLATVNSGFALVKSPWRLSRKNQYLLHPYYANEWVRE